MKISPNKNNKGIFLILQEMEVWEKYVILF